jgi:hypothetical protein
VALAVSAYFVREIRRTAEARATKPGGFFYYPKKDNFMSIQSLDAFSERAISILGEQNEDAKNQIRRIVYKRGPVLVAAAVNAAIKLYNDDERPTNKNGDKFSLAGCFFYVYRSVKKQYKDAGKLLPAWPYGRPD